jgi:hypothetical protein
MIVAKSTLFLPHGKGLSQEVRGLADGPGVSQHEPHHIFHGLIDQEFLVVGKSDQGVRSLLDDFDLVGIEDEFLAGIESM